MLDHQLPDGMIPDAVYDEGTITSLEMPVAAAVTKPPIIGWVAMHVYDQTGDEQMLREIYEPLVRWNSWWFGLNDDDLTGSCSTRTRSRPAWTTARCGTRACRSRRLT
jgi:hypothetical protein